MTISFERAALLFQVAEKCAANPVHMALAQLANVELSDMTKEAASKLAERAEKIRQEEAAAVQKKLEAAAEAEEDHPVVDNTAQAQNPEPVYVEPTGDSNAETVIDRRV